MIIPSNQFTIHSTEPTNGWALDNQILRHYRDGQRDGPEYHWYADRQLRTYSEWKNDELNGLCLEWDINKLLSGYGTCENGLYHGLAITLDGGEVRTITQWRNGEKHGLALMYSSTGNLCEYDIYKQDKRITNDVFGQIPGLDPTNLSEDDVVILGLLGVPECKQILTVLPSLLSSIPIIVPEKYDVNLEVSFTVCNKSGATTLT